MRSMIVVKRMAVTVAIEADAHPFDADQCTASAAGGPDHPLAVPASAAALSALPLAPAVPYHAAAS